MVLFSETVKKISTSFIQEAQKSPQLISDMARMEFYMSESYNGRLLVELLQNADDAQSTKIFCYYNNGNFYFANNGRPFDEDDLIAISRSGASTKKRGVTIGYRGIGFKSASAVSNDILIYSSDTCFSFSKKQTAKMLNMSENDVPTIRIPILVNSIDKEIANDVSYLQNSGFSTIFIFKNANVCSLVEDIRDINDGYFIFLNYIQECCIDLKIIPYLKYCIHRSFKHNNQRIVVNDGDKESQWNIIKKDEVSIALYLDGDVIVPCSEDKAFYHCYLPTLEKCIYPCKINADFSTDPSRKHITLDEKTKESLSKIADIIMTLLKKAVDEADTGIYKNIFSMLLKAPSFSKVNIFLKEILSKRIVSQKWLKLTNGELITASEYKIFPSTFSIERIEQIRKIPGKISEQSLPNNVYMNIDDIDTFLEKYSECSFSLDLITADMCNILFVKQLNEESYIQLLTNIIREEKISSLLNCSATSIDSVYVKNIDNVWVKLRDLGKSNKKLQSKLKTELKERLSNSEVLWLQNKVGNSQLIIEGVESSESLPEIRIVNQPYKTNIDPHISKWRDAESKCLQIEEFFGNVAEDVSLKNVGYDIYSITPSGEKRYIEVKSVKKDYSFSLTNNEYTAAHQYGNQYYICLLVESDAELEVRYIKNPLANAIFEKRVKQWEWICLQSQFEESYNFLYEKIRR